MESCIANGSTYRGCCYCTFSNVYTMGRLRKIDAQNSNFNLSQNSKVSGSQNSDFKVRIQSQNSEFEVRTPNKMNHMWPYSSSRTHASANTNALYLHRSALQKQAEVRDACTSFFLEVVSRFCLSEDQSPSGEVVELLFSLLISTHGPYTPPLNTHTPWLYQIKEQALNRRRLLPQGFL